MKDEVIMPKKKNEDNTPDGDLKEMIEKVFKKLFAESSSNKDMASSVLAATETLAKDE